MFEIEQLVSFLSIFINTTQRYPGARQILKQCKYHLARLWPLFFCEIPQNIVCYWRDVN